MPSRGSQSDGPPPAYSRFAKSLYPSSLRFPTAFLAFIALIWSIAMGVQSIRYHGDEYESSKEQTFDMILAIIYFVIAALAVGGLFITLMNKLPIGRMIIILGPLGVALVVGSQIISVVEHFSAKTDIINQCIETYGNATVSDSLNPVQDFGDTTTLTQAEATTYCNNSWSHGSISTIGWLVLACIVSFIFAFIALGYYRQLVNPSLIHQRGRPVETQSFQMQPPPPGGYYPPSNSSQPWIVPPYPGPPASDSQPFEKSEYQPEAEWANYAPPDGPPPANYSRNPYTQSSAHRAEEEAWERAQAEGVTAHLTGHASPPPTRTGFGEEGYLIHNDEEDEAWERARADGVTAHLTGQPARSRETEV